MVGELCAAQGGGGGERAIAANKFEAVGGEGAVAGAAMEEGDAVGEIEAEGILGKKGTALGVELADDVHGALFAAFAEDPLDIGGDGDAPGAGGSIAQDNGGKFERGVEGNVDGGGAGEPFFGALEDGIAVTVAAGGGGAADGRAGHGRPDAAGFVVADIEGFAGGVGDGVVMPGGEAELVGVFFPGIGGPGFADDGAEVGVGQDVDPGGGGGGAGCDLDDVFPSVGGEAAEAVEVFELAGGEGGGRFIAITGDGGQEFGDIGIGDNTAVDLVGEGSMAVAENEAGDGAEKDAVVFGDLVYIAYKNSAGLIEELAFGAGLDEADDGVEEILAIAGIGLGPDDEIDFETLLAPVGVGLDEAADQIEIGLVGDGEQDDGAVAGDAVAPEGGLVATIGGDDAGAAAAVGAGIEEGAGEPGIILDIGFVDAELVEQDLAAGPGEGENALGHARVVAAVDIGVDGGAIGGDAEEGIDADGGTGFDAYAVADGGDGVEDESGAVGEGPGGVEGGGVAQGASAADKSGAVGFEGGAAEHGAARNQQGVEHPGVGVLGGAGAAGED